ncbi:MAG: glutaredoxin family protein [Methanocalculus sp. MSAO_Arc1]|uniref:glutaredoxin family protein n=1 Tax=Methanocalculus TaxID=71151 RepID=UPI000FEF2EC0|nr:MULTISPECIES: glutaredoxin domain-containing protein [unclassified Methanocalculus]MCP1662371.1 glutaredoxin [Methanocalculus sp. AMF5]RQD81382.1 MAG: glutaredoxin family protein [Methanocalculus sp. MSAO_Arc1]
MTSIDTIIVYSLEVCPNCEILKQYLQNNTIPYRERALDDPEVLTDLRMNGVFVMEAPVLQIGDRYLTSKELFSDGDVSPSIADECRR